MPTSFRQDVVAGLVTILEAYKTANPTLLRHVFDVRPQGPVSDFPYAYVALRPESIRHASGTRTRTMQPSVVVVDTLASNGETYDRFDVLVDGLVDQFTAYPHIVANTIWDEMSVAEEDTPGFAAVRFTFSNVEITEGRP